MSYLKDLINDVEATHKNLGELTAVSQIIVKARKMAMLISPSGCGKSTSMMLVGRNTKNSFMPDKLSIAGLSVMADRLTGFRSVVVVDDITTTQTDYARKTTITTLTALVYSHRIQTVMLGQEFEIDDFFGSALVGVQPVILRNLMLLDEWDGSIQDKALRYYHMFRPLSPDISTPKVSYRDGLEIDQVNDFKPNTDNKSWHKLMELGLSQWSRARTLEHMKDMLKAIASLEMRKDVIDEDYHFLARLLRPMAIENIVVIKEQFEGQKILDNTLLLLLVEYYTYNGKFSLAQLSEDYKIKLPECYKIMATQKKNFQQISKSPTIYQITDQLLSQLKKYDLELKQERMILE